MRRSERGFALMELIASMAILAVVLATSTSVLFHAGAITARTNAGADGIRGLHRALEILEADVRSADRVEAGTAGTLRLAAAGGDLEWRLTGGVLWRHGPDREERVASGISGFRVAPEEGLWRISLDLAGRAGRDGRRAGVTTLAGPRRGEDAR